LEAYLLCVPLPGFASPENSSSAAAKLHLIELPALRIALTTRFERLRAASALARRLIGARQLIENLIVARIIWVGLSRVEIQLDASAP